MKHILNNLSDEEKNSIREQHTGGMNVVTENFNRLLGSKLGDSKPLVETEELPEGMFSRELSKTDKLKRDINDAISRKIASPKTTGVSGKWSYGEVEKSMEQILNDIEDVVSRYRGEESESFVSEQSDLGRFGNAMEIQGQLVKNLANILPTNILANMAKSAIMGDAKSFNQVLDQEKSRLGQDYAKLKNAVTKGDIAKTLQNIGSAIQPYVKQMESGMGNQPKPSTIQKPMGGVRPTGGGPQKPGVKPTMIQKPMGGVRPTNFVDPKVKRKQMMTGQRPDGLPQGDPRKG
jgi:hypothetical protein